MSRSKIAKFWLAVSVLVSAAVLSTPSQALPSFARQTNKACSACHFENFPMLNDYGRAFKASGFTEVYAEKTRENTDSAELSIPLVLNAAFFGTMRYDRYSGSDSSTNPNVSEWTIPEEASLFLSGRVANNVGFHSEVGLRPSAGLAAFKLPFSFPINDTMRVLAIPFAADGHGPSYGFETLNTGASDIHLTYENAGQTSAQAYLGTADAGATGASLVLWDPRFYVSYTKWAPTAGPAGIGSNYSPGSGIQTGKTPGSNYFRAVYFLPTPGWDTAIGYQNIGGTSANPYDATNCAGQLAFNSPCVTLPYDGGQVDTKLWAIDAQIQGAIGEHPLGVYFTHGVAPATPAGGTANLFNGGPNQKSATTIAASYGLIPGKINVSAAYRKADDGTGTTSSDNAFTAGVVYLFSQNVKFLLEASKLQNPGAFDTTDVNGNAAAGIKQKITFKLFYDM